MIGMENIPLIIDQPEDNLDNQSIFMMLREFIKQAKKKRQIIIVTHNPNLAVGADAEQIIHVKIDKRNNNRFTYNAGAIEDPVINKFIVNILEGTMPAFDKRKLKYLV
jgi:predicted ATPase